MLATTDPNGDRLSYTLDGTDAASFTVRRTSTGGQLRTAPNAVLDYEDRSVYTVTVRASDGRGGTDSIIVTVNVGDVDEPPLTPGAPTVTATSGSTTSLDVSWTTPANAGKPPITSYDLQYRQEGTTGDFQNGPQNVSDTSMAIPNLQPGILYQVRVRATNAEGDGPYSLPGLGRTNTPPTVTIARHIGTPVGVFEDTDVRFTLTMDPAPTSAIQVRVSVIDMPSRAFLHIDEPSTKEISIPAEHMTVDFEIRVDDDSTDEVDGSITAMVQSGTGYSVGSPDFGFVAIWDDEELSPPAELHANGDIVNGEVSIWWEAVDGATGYDLQYAEEDCPVRGEYTPSPCNTGNWTTVNAIWTTDKARLSVGTDNYDQLASKSLYRLQVRGTNTHGESAWSAPAFIYPTSNSDLPITLVATANLYGYLPKNYDGDHQFGYIICDGTIPAGVSIDADDIEDAVERWRVVKKSGDSSMITITRVTDNAPDEVCQPPRPRGVFFPVGHNTVIFVDDKAMEWALCWIDNPPACWRSSTQYSEAINRLQNLPGPLLPIEPGTVLLRETPTVGGSVSGWNALAHNNACNLAEHTITHEVGHALGIGRIQANYREVHPRNVELSIMSSGYTHNTRYCGPQPYDIVAVMANYQSR